MQALNLKLFRDLWQIKGQAIAISLVIAAGVSLFIMYLSTFESLQLTRSAYYDRYRFADVFASLKRAPLWLQQRIAQIPGVARAETRVVVNVTLDVEGLSEPAVGRLISIPERREAMLNDVFLRRGRYIEPGRPDEVLASEAFALAHGFDPGDTVAALINGRYRRLKIVGIALSPEYVYSIPSGEMIPDDRRFGILWMGRKALATAFDMEGAFNDVALRLTARASEPEVIAHLDRLLKRYGGLGALPRSLQISNWYLSSELVGLQTIGTFFFDAMDVLLDIQFNVAQRQDVTVSFVEPASARAFHEIEHLPGVVYSEPMRLVPARLRFGHRTRQIGITGLPSDAHLQRVVDTSLRPLKLPPGGLILSRKLAEILDTRPGETLTVEVLEGARPVRRVVVASLVEEYMGTAAYMEIGALQRLMQEGGTLSGASLQVDAAFLDDLYRRLKATPAVAGVNLKRAAMNSFEKMLEETVYVMIFFNVLFSSIIAFGVVYNTARISLSERSRELATLRVIGFTRGEISFILLGELAVVTLIAVPLGLLLGYGLAAVTVIAFDTELYRFPLVVTARTYAWSAITVLTAVAVSGLIVRRKLDRLDLVAVLKTKE